MPCLIFGTASKYDEAAYTNRFQSTVRTALVEWLEAFIYGAEVRGFEFGLGSQAIGNLLLTAKQ